MKQAIKRGDKIIVRFSGSDFRESLSFIKTVKGRFYNQNSKEWSIPNNENNIKLLEVNGFFGESQKTEKQTKKIQHFINKEYQDIIIPEKYNRLYAFQQDCMSFMKYHNSRALLSLDQGCGKSATSLCMADMEKDYPLLIVVPASLKFNWKKEYIKWINGKQRIKICFGYDSIPFFDKKYEVVIINYELLAGNVEEKIIKVKGKKDRKVYRPNEKLKAFMKNDFKCMILDECQYIKGKSLRYEAVKLLNKNIPHLLGLSGTPIKKKPEEFFNILNLLRPDIFKSEYAYKQRYCNPKLVRMGRRKFWTYNGMSNEVELYNILRNEIMIRYMKSDVLTDIPQRNRIPTYIELENYNKYVETEKAIQKEIDDNKMIGLQKINILRQLVSELKAKACFDFIDNLLSDNDKIVIFAHHKETISHYMEKYKGKIAKIDGSVTGKKREEAKERFIKSSRCKILIGNDQAMGVGIDGLQDVCDVCVFIEFPWNSADMDQCEDRLIRIGQQNIVNIYYLIANNTIDEDTISLIDEGRIIRTKIMEGKEVEEFDLIGKLLQKLKNK